MKLAMRALDFGLVLSVPILVLVHLLVAPYTKVEESFNIQATHDVLVYGTPTSDINRKLSSSYDHFSFSGAVPRTFFGPVLLAGIAQPIIALVGFNHAQFVVRAILGLLNASCLLGFAHTLRRAYGAPTARWYLLLQASQFHVMFYASRTLPNMFAFSLTTTALSLLVPIPGIKTTRHRRRLAITMLVFAAAIFRSEVAILLFTSILYLLLLDPTALHDVIFSLLTSGPAALLISVPLDSYFWQTPLWPELWGFYYNAILGSSSAWGVSPWHYYFTSALPRLLLNPLSPLLLLPLSLLHPALAPAAPRFIIYALPPLTAAAALAANLVFARRAKAPLPALLLAASVLASLAATAAMLLVSSLNYPGGDALAHLRDLVQAAADAPVVPVHADVLSCMTGVTLFGTAIGRATPNPRGVAKEKVQRGGGGVSLLVDKTEDEETLAREEFWQRFDYVLMEEPGKGYAGVEVVKGGGGAVEEGVERDGRVVGKGAVVAEVKRRVRRVTGRWWVGPRTEPKIYIMKRIKNGEGAREAVGV
ncbi:Alg9-like mannosyltransferase family-domain-containing protein [Schizothecium vesticola]|uniref:Mannosyltransferase n=1 Tax=Schizothecium vesticola TaxID=314040 RepID=A0AA40EVB6_9PEZI|nr:Alg9-like mannosyltransferase family-domain-containing protein [Schizothecium vesticola]